MTYAYSVTSSVTRQRTSIPAGEAFDPNNDDAYFRWRARKLENYPNTKDQLIVEIKDPGALTRAEHQAIVERCRKANMAIYTCSPARSTGKDAIRRFGEQLGLCRLDMNLCADNDSITSVRVLQAGRQQGYIPYSDRALNWHTDGYYNHPTQRIRAFIIHCVQDAASGGENAFLDHEMAYLSMRDKNPSHVAAFMQADVMRIPANIEQGTEIRRAEVGPVFTLDTATNTLYMRYTARKHNIEWKNDPLVQAGVQLLEDLLAGDGRYIFRHRLEPGQGIVCNNVLHSRSAFVNDAATRHERLLYRARYYDRVDST